MKSECRKLRCMVLECLCKWPAFAYSHWLQCLYEVGGGADQKGAGAAEVWPCLKIRGPSIAAIATFALSFALLKREIMAVSDNAL